MKTLIFIILIVSFMVFSCKKEEPQPRTIETKTGLETESATQQEVDTLTNKMDKLMEDTQP